MHVVAVYLRCFWHPSTFWKQIMNYHQSRSWKMWTQTSGQSQLCATSLYSNPPMQSCSVAVPFQHVQYRVQDVSCPKMPYSQSQCSFEIGPSSRWMFSMNSDNKAKLKDNDFNLTCCLFADTIWSSPGVVTAFGHSTVLASKDESIRTIIKLWLTINALPISITVWCICNNSRFELARIFLCLLLAMTQTYLKEIPNGWVNYLKSRH